MRRRRACHLLGLIVLGGLGTLAVLPACGQEAANPEANKALVRRYFDALSGGDLKKLDDVLAPDFVDRTPGNPNQTRGPGVIRDTQTKARGIFTDIGYTVDDLLADGDRVAARYTVRARHKASGKSIEVTGVSFFRIAGGRIQEGWIVNDQIELFRQLGYTLAPPQAAPPTATPPPGSAPAGGGIGARNRAVLRRRASHRVPTRQTNPPATCRLLAEGHALWEEVSLFRLGGDGSGHGGRLKMVRPKERHCHVPKDPFGCAGSRSIGSLRLLSVRPAAGPRGGGAPDRRIPHRCLELVRLACPPHHAGPHS